MTTGPPTRPRRWRERFGVRLIPPRRAAQPQRRTQHRRARGARRLVAFVDDDVFVPPGWLDELVEGAARYPDAEAFGGPIRASPRGPPAARAAGARNPRSPRSTSATRTWRPTIVWGANFAVRRSAVERIGQFDETRDRLHGDEEEWLRAAARGRRAGRVPRRRRGWTTAAPRTTRACGRWPEPPTRAGAARGRATAGAGARPSLARELRVLAGCGWHTLRRACPQGLIMGAHSAGACRGGAAAAVTPTLPDPRLPVGRRRRRDRPLAARQAHGRRAGLSARSIGRAGRPAAGSARAQRRRPSACSWSACTGPARCSPRRSRRCARDRHACDVALGSTAAGRRRRSREHTVAEGLAGGKFENLNRVLEAGARHRRCRLAARRRRRRAAAARASSTASSASARRFELDLAQPAQTLRSHSAWRVTRRRPASLVRETRFVEIGPRDGVRAARRRRAAAVPRAALRLGARPALGGAGRRARLATRRRRRAARPPRAGLVAAAYRPAGRARPRRPASSPTAHICRARAPAMSWPCTAPAEVADVRLLFVCPDMRTGGAERHWATLIPALAWRAASSVKLLALADDGAVVRRCERARRAGRVPAPSPAHRPARACGAPCRSGAAFEPDVVVTRGVSGQLVGEAIARRARRRPRAQRAHAAHARRRARTAAAAPARAHPAGRSRVDRVIAVTERQAQPLERARLPARAHRRRAERGVRARRAGDRAPSPRARRDGFAVLCVAGLRPEKRVDLFIEAVGGRAQRQPRVRGLRRRRGAGARASWSGSRTAAA